MANKMINMNKLRQILRHYHQGLSKSQISLQSGLSRNTIKKYLRKYLSLNLNYKEVQTKSDHELSMLFGSFNQPQPSDRFKTLSELFPKIEKDLKKKGYTMKDAHQAYQSEHPDGFGKTQFGIYYREWKKRSNPVMRIHHKVADKVYVDFAGEKLDIIDKDTGEVRQVEFFVATLGASQYTYVEARESQKKQDFIAACENALHYFGGVPMAIVPDNLKSAVTKSDKYEPSLNETFADFAEHYGTAVLPARAYRPKDKSLVEGAVKISYNRIYTVIRQNEYYSLKELNEAIWEALEVYNDVLLTGRDYSRKQLFEEVEKDELQPLPALRYEFKKQAVVTVMKDGHVCLREDHHYYSVPYKFIGRKVKLIYTLQSVNIYYKYECIATHIRNIRKYFYTTLTEHMASTHRFMSEWNAERFLKWAESIDPDVREFITNILDNRSHPEQAYKSCLGVLNLEKKVGRVRLINACRRALDFGNYNYKSVKMILEKKLDQIQSDQADQQEIVLPEHDNIRGKHYYQ